MLKCAIFDFDGTLFDSMSIWDTVGEIYLRSLGKEPKESLREDVRALSLYQSACYFIKEYDLMLAADEIVAGINRIIEDFYINEILPKPGAVQFLDKMKEAGISMCIATATDRYLIEAALKRCGMDTFFSEIFTCSEVGHSKSEPVIFRKAMERFGANHGNTIVFEDAFHAAQTAKNDGFMIAVVFDKSETRQAELRQMCDCYIEDFAHTELFWKFASAR